MTRPRLLDLFCGAGGAAMGYHRAGFDVVGVDIKPQPRYPFAFHLGDAMEWPLDGFDAIHASPPCQRYSVSTPAPYRENHPDLLPAIRDRLATTGRPWVIENVPGAPMRADFKLCGCMFPNLPELARQRWFETDPMLFDLRPPCHHVEPIVVVAGHGRCRNMKRTGLVADWRRVMDIDWMTRDELAQAIPPAYTEYIGGQLIEQISEPRAAAQEALL